MTNTINPDKLAQLDQIQLDRGGHPGFDSGHCSMEVVAWLADQGHTDAPSCSSPVLTRFVIRLNDRWDFEKRQQLKPYLPRLVGTNGDGKDELREQVATRYAADLLVPWLRLAGLNAEVEKIKTATPDDLASILWQVRDAAWAARSKAYDAIRAKVREHLKNRPAAAAADAVAVADVAAAAVAAAEADVAAVAVAVADVAAVAVAVADVAAAAVAVADVAAAAVAVADVAAAAVAVADAVAAADADAPYGDSYSAAYKAACDYYRAHPLPISQQIADLAAEQNGAALALLDKLIDPPARS